MSNAFLTSSILDGVPKDTQVLCLGEVHSNLLHRLYLYLNLPTLAEQGLAFLDEKPFHHRTAIEQTHRVLGYRPSHIKGKYFLEFDENTRSISENKKDTFSYCDAFDYHDNIKHFSMESQKNFNVYSFSNMAATNIKIHRMALSMGMPVIPIDAPDMIGFDGKSNADMEYRNRFMAENIVDMLGTYDKVFVWGGYAHLFSAPRSTAADNSLQSILQLHGIKTHSIALAPAENRILYGKRKSTDSITIKDFLDESSPGITQSKEWKKHILSAANARRETSINLDTYCNNPGTHLPDKLVVFPQRHQDWLRTTANLAEIWDNPVLEDAAWQAIWHKFGRNAHSIRKQEKREAYKNSSSKSTLSCLPI